MRPRLTAQPFPHIAIGQQLASPCRLNEQAPEHRVVEPALAVCLVVGTRAIRLPIRQRCFSADNYLRGPLLLRPAFGVAGPRRVKGHAILHRCALKDGLCFSRDRRHHVAVPLISDHYNAITWPAAPLQRDDKADRRVEPVLIALLGRAWRHRYQPTEARPSTPLSVPPINGLSRRFASTPNSNFTPSPPNAARLYPAGSPGRTPRSRSRPAAFRRSGPPTGRRSADRASSRAGGRSSPSRADRRRYRSRYLPNGQAWLLFGADSGFEARTEIYFTRAAVTFTPM